MQISKMKEKIQKRVDSDAEAKQKKVESSFVNSETLLANILNEIQKLIQFSWAGLYFYYEDSNRLVLNRQLGKSSDFENRVRNRFADWVLQNKQTLLIPNLQNDNNFKSITDFSTYSLIYVPVFESDIFVGILAIERFQKESFRDEDIAILSNFADIIAKAIEDVRNHQILEDRAGQLNILLEIGQALTSILDLDELFEKIYEHVRRVMDSDAFFICFYEEGDDFVDMEFVVDEGKPFHKIREPLGTGTASRAIAEKQGIILNRSVTDYEILKNSNANPFGNRSRLSKSLIAAPIIFRERVIGAISTQSYRFNAFTQQHLELLSAIASQSAIAIENARLYELEKKRVWQSNAINKVGQIITSTLNPDKMLKNVVESVSEYFNYDHVTIFLIDKENNTLVNKAYICRAQVDKNDDMQIVIKNYEGIVGWTAKHGETKLVKDVTKEEQFIKCKYCQSRTELCVPIKIGSNILGVINIENQEFNTLDLHDIQAMQNIASHLAQMLENAYLYEMIKIEKNKLEKVLTNLDEGVLIIDSDLNIVYMNRWLIDQFGRSDNEMNTLAIFHDIENAFRADVLKTALSEKLPPIEIENKNNRIYQVYHTPIIISDGQHGVLTVVNDITHKKKFETEIIQAEKYKAVLNLVATVAHELNQPLTGITCYCSLLLEDINKDDKYFEEITEIEEQAFRLSELLRKFQQLTRLENKGYLGNDEILDLNNSSPK